MITLIANLPAAVGQWKGRRFPAFIDYFLRAATKEIHLSIEENSRAMLILFTIITFKW